METRMTLGRVRELDAKCGVEILEFLQLNMNCNNPPPLFLSEEDAAKLPKMADSFEVPFRDFQSYVHVQTCVVVYFQTDYEGFSLLESVVRNLKSPLTDFYDYLTKRHEAFHQAIDNEDENFFFPT